MTYLNNFSCPSHQDFKIHLFQCLFFLTGQFVAFGNEIHRHHCWSTGTLFLQQFDNRQAWLTLKTYGSLMHTYVPHIPVIPNVAVFAVDVNKHLIEALSFFINVTLQFRRFFDWQQESNGFVLICCFFQLNEFNELLQEINSHHCSEVGIVKPEQGTSGKGTSCILSLLCLS